MNLYSSHRRILFGLHWVSASTAGCGGMAWLIDLTWTLLKGGRDHFDPPILVVLLPILGGTIVGLMMKSQQLILERVGLAAAYWIAGTFGGLVGGFLLGMPAALLCGVALHSSLEYDAATFWMNNILVFCVGVTTAAAQGVGFAVPIHKWIVWVMSGGFFACLWLACGSGNLFSQFSIISVGMVIGALYGLVTGMTLAWIVPTPRELLAEQRYRSWLGRRTLPGKIDWSFCGQLEQHP